MKKKIFVIIMVLLIALAVTSFVFAESKIKLETELIFRSATDNSIILNITNWGRKSVTISKDGRYIDEIGSAGSWICHAKEDVVLGPRQSKYIEFSIEKAVAHGDHSILVFFFQHDNQWYLAKTGHEIGLEYFDSHN